MAQGQNQKLSLKTSDLGYLGEDFQEKLVRCFFEDKQFFQDIYHIVDQNMFTTEHLRGIVGIMKDRYATSMEAPTYDEVKMLIRVHVRDAITVNIMTALVDKIKDLRMEGMDIVKENSSKFFKQQNLTKAINKSIEIIRKGDLKEYSRIESIIQNALLVNNRQDNGFRVFDSIEADLSPDYRQTIPTGCPELDSALYGGIGRRELGVIVAPMGTGKTSVTTGFAASAAISKCHANNNQGFKVLHFFFEDEEVNIRRKYFGYVLDIDACTLSLPEVRPEAIRRLNENTEINHLIQNNIRCKRLSTGEVAASGLKLEVQRQISLGFKPDLIIVDYFECLAKEKGQSSSDSEWTGEAITMRKLESLCKELNVAMWVPVQGTKGSIGQEYVGLMHAGGSVAKTQIGHIVIQLAQTKQQKTQGLMNVYIGKLRAVRMDKDEFPNVKFNNGTGKFDMSGAQTSVDEIYGDTPQYPNQTQQQVAKRVAGSYGRR